MPDTDKMAAALDEIRGRGYRNGASGALCARLSDCADIDVPRLLAAVDAVLERHKPDELTLRHPCPAHLAGMTDRESLRERAAYVRSLGHCDDCDYFPPRCEQCRRPYPCDDVLTVSRALLGEDA
jgi:hypothetical protein